MRLIGALVLTLGGLPLSACSSLGLDGDWLGFGGDARSTTTAATATGASIECPLYGVLEGTGEATRHRGGSISSDSMVMQARVTDVSLSCRQSAPGMAAIDLMVEITANRGPAAQDEGEIVRYFVEIADPADRPVARDTFDLAMPFGRSAQSRQREEFALEIPVAQGWSADQYRVYVGFDRGS